MGNFSVHIQTIVAIANIREKLSGGPMRIKLIYEAPSSQQTAFCPNVFKRRPFVNEYFRSLEVWCALT